MARSQHSASAIADSQAAMQIAMPAPGEHTVHDMSSRPSQSLSTVTFPYGFPEPGDYRIFVQVKRAGRVITGVFDATVPQN